MGVGNGWAQKTLDMECSARGLERAFLLEERTALHINYALGIFLLACACVTTVIIVDV